jgi:hypothetical protein
VNNTKLGINPTTLTLGVNDMTSRIQQLAKRVNMSYDEFIGEMRKRGCSEPTAEKLWNGTYETFDAFNDNDIYLSNLRKAADVFKVKTGTLLND